MPSAKVAVNPWEPPTPGGAPGWARNRINRQTFTDRETDGRAESPQRGLSWMDKNGRKGSAEEKRLGGEGEEG